MFQRYCPIGRNRVLCRCVAPYKYRAKLRRKSRIILALGSTMNKAFAAIVLLAVAVSAVPVEQERGRLALQNPDLFQGDILGFEPGDRNIRPDVAMRWPNGVVPYEIEYNLKHMRGAEDLIREAMKNYEDNTCIRFVEKTDEHSRALKIFSGQGCYSFVGMIGLKEQPLSIGNGCHHVGTIVHELGHALGFFHEQNRSDRDDHLVIYWENIIKGMETQFQLLKPHQNTLINDFDHESIMLYGNYAFSKDGDSMTMEARNGQKLEEPYDKKGLTKSDIRRVNEMYNCRDYL